MTTKQYQAIIDWVDCRCEHCSDQMTSESSKCALYPAYEKAVFQRNKDNEAKK